MSVPATPNLLNPWVGVGTAPIDPFLKEGCEQLTGVVVGIGVLRSACLIGIYNE